MLYFFLLIRSYRTLNLKKTIFYRLIKKDKEEQIQNLEEGLSSIDEIEQQYVSILTLLLTNEHILNINFVPQDDNMKELQNIFLKLDKNRKVYM